jgi:hypothetical protein
MIPLLGGAPVRALRAVAALAISATLLAALGCEKLKTTLTVFPDGSGRIDFANTLGGHLTSAKLTMADSDEKRQEAADQSIHRKLAMWDGVCAWTDVKSSVTGEGEERAIAGSAVGYFEDLSKLRCIDESLAHDFKWAKNKDGGFTFEEVTSPRKKDENAPRKDPADSLLRKMSEEQLEMTISMTASLFDGLEIVRVVVMPGEVTEAAGAGKKEGRSATATFSDKDLGELVKKSYTRGAALRKKVDAGELAEDKAKAELEAELKEALKPFKATSRAGDAAAEQAEHRKALDAAKKAFSGSPTEKKVKEAKEKAKASKATKQDDEGE